MKKNPKKTLRTKADKLFQQAGIKKWGEECYCCGSVSGKIQIHHFVPKGISSFLRYNLLNGIPLCIGCHFAYHHKGNPLIYEGMKEKMGLIRFNTLIELAKEQHSSITTIKWYRNHIKELEKYLNNGIINIEK